MATNHIPNDPDAQRANKSPNAVADAVAKMSDDAVVRTLEHLLKMDAGTASVSPDIARQLIVAMLPDGNADAA